MKDNIMYITKNEENTIKYFQYPTTKLMRNTMKKKYLLSLIHTYKDAYTWIIRNLIITTS
jgi:hypothetical protein